MEYMKPLKCFIKVQMVYERVGCGNEKDKSLNKIPNKKSLPNGRDFFVS